jgi:hypothetical protein
MIRESSDHLLSWYENRARPFIETHSKADLAVVDRDRERILTALNAIDQDVAVCFVGNSGVGKSTLLNALLSDRQTILPNDRVGPQTARPTTVRYAPKPYFRVTYVGRDEINELRFLLEVAHQLKTRGEAKSDLEAGGDTVDERTVREMEDVLGDEDTTTKEDSRTKLERAQKRARLLVQGGQDGPVDLEYLIDATRAVMGTKPKFGRPVAPEDADRVAQARECVELGREGNPRIVEGGDEPAKFLEHLGKHAAGSLAPLILELEVGWTADVLANGLVLVDLPGLGVEGDEFQAAAETWISQKARAVILVTDRSGLMTASVEPLRKARFFNKLLHIGGNSESEPVSLGMAMVKLDDVASAAWDKEYEAKGDDAPAWNELFAQTREDGKALMRAHAERELTRIVEDGIDATRADRKEVIDRLLASLDVHAVSAPEYRRLLRRHPHHPAKIVAVEESGIPGLQKALTSLAASYRRRRVARASAALLSFEQHTRATINLIRATWEQESRAEQEAKALGEELDTFLVPLRKELAARRVRFGAFLGETVPAKISAAVSKAALDAEPALERYLRKFREFPYPTLAAVLRKGGRHEKNDGRVINMPKELALKFEEPVAVAWSKGVLAEVRKRTTEHGKDYASITKDVVVWAKDRGARVQPKMVEALHERLEHQATSLSKVGKEATDEIRQAVSDSLAKDLEDLISATFVQFIRANRHRGTGAKDRIIVELFLSELARVAKGAAQPASEKILKTAFDQARIEITARLGEFVDPLDAARAALVQSHEDSVRRSDKRKQQSVLGEAEALATELRAVGALAPGLPA